MSATSRNACVTADPRNMNKPNPADTAPVSAMEARNLFADWKAADALVLAVSGGPDSMALLWLAARWRKSLKSGPALIAVTVDHGLRQESAAEAKLVKTLAAQLGIPHRTMRWRGHKPKTGLPAAAREARYELLAQAARRVGAAHVLTAHTRDDQAETLLMRMSRGSGLAGLAGMARETGRGGVIIARPLLDIPKSRLLATLAKAKIAFADDPTNRDLQFTRPRWRALSDHLAFEGLDSRKLARLAARLARANEALETACDAAEASLVLQDAQTPGCWLDLGVFRTFPEEIRLRLLQRLIDRFGHEGPAELGKTEALLAKIDALDVAVRSSALTTTLAGAIVRIKGHRLTISPAPPRRNTPARTRP